MRAAPTPGERFGPYDILGPLGSGGMGIVFRARDTRLGREVALKTLPPESVSDPARLQRFEQEARAASALNHPNVLAVFDVGREGDTPFLVTELLAGETLRERLKHGPLPARRVIELATQIAHGLAAVHEKGIVHRDLKPDNLFITRDGQVKILDFGVARTAESATPPTGTLPLTQSGAVMGTAGYMAPEQVRGRVADARSDLFALGAILYECLSAQLAFPGETPVERGYAILNAEPRELDARLAVPAPLLRVMRRCLEKTPEQRFQHARDLVYALEAISEPSGPAPVVPTAPTRSRAPWLAALGGAALVAAIAVVAWPVPEPVAPPEPAPVITSRRVSFRNGSIFNARFTADGRGIAYSAAFEEDPPRTWVGVLDGAELRPASAAGTMLFDVSARDEVLTGAPPTEEKESGLVLSRASLVGTASRPLYQNVKWADLGPGDLLVLTRHTEDSGYVVECPPGNRLVTSRDMLAMARLSPDGKYIAYQRHPVSGDDRGSIEIIDRAGKQLASSKQAWTLEGLAWTPDSKEVWFSAGYESVSRQLFGMTLTGVERRVYSGPSSLRLLDIDARGRVLVVSGLSRSRMFGRLNGEKRERSLSWLDGSMPIALSDDGKAILFLEGYGPAGTEVQTWFRRFGERDETPWMVSIGWGRALSPDKRWAIVAPTPPFQTLRLVPIETGEPRDLPPGVHNAITAVHFFPNGTAIAFSARDDKGKGHLFVQSLLTGPEAVGIDPKPRQVGALALHLVAPPSPDGKWLVGKSRDLGVTLVDVETGEGKPLPGLLPGDLPLQWSTDGKALWVSRPGRSLFDISSQLLRYDLATAKLTPNGVIQPPDLVGMGHIKQGVVAPDGKQYVYTVHQELNELILIEGVR